jgi:thioredoxin-like negative regulator of GroEL
MPYPEPAGPGTPIGGSVALTTTAGGAMTDLSEPETTDELERLLAAEDRLVLLAFLDPGCEPCRELRRQLEDLAAERRDVCTVVLVDASRNPEAAAKFQVGVFPTIVFIKRGTELRRFKGGALPPSTLRLLQ